MIIRPTVHITILINYLIHHYFDKLHYNHHLTSITVFVIAIYFIVLCFVVVVVFVVHTTILTKYTILPPPTKYTTQHHTNEAHTETPPTSLDET